MTECPSPFRFDPFPNFQANDREIDRSLTQTEQVAVQLFDVARDAIPVRGAESLEDLLNHEIQRPFYHLGFVLIHCLPCGLASDDLS